LVADLVVRFPDATLIASEAVVRDDLAKVIRFVEKPAEGLHLPLDMRGTPFQRRVWERLRAIPVGRTVTYKDLARSLRPARSPAPAPPIRSRWRFPATASCAAMAIWPTIVGASSASGK
jgi:O6-methylguanine-DNA--protein-cysteine methyltransferase